jgi:ABC-2 type transport system permease protein
MSVITTSVVTTVTLVLAWAFFHFNLLAIGLPVFGFLLVLFLIGIAFGIFGMGVVIRLGPSAEWFIWPIPAILAPFVGVFYPLSVLPSWMQAISKILPPAYVFQNLRSLVTTGAYVPGDLIIGVVLSLFYIALAYWFLHRIYRHALRSGLFARYSAENTGL